MELSYPIWSKHASKLYEYSRHKPEESALYRLVFNYREEFKFRYQELFEERYGFLRDNVLESFEIDNSIHKRLRAVRKTLGYLESNPRHPSLNTHKFTSLTGPNGEEIFEAYAENKAPAAFGIFWFYDPSKKDITIIAITQHP